jgi:hypothetical protein
MSFQLFEHPFSSYCQKALIRLLVRRLERPLSHRA